MFIDMKTNPKIFSNSQEHGFFMHSYADQELLTEYRSNPCFHRNKQQSGRLPSWLPSEPSSSSESSFLLWYRELSRYRKGPARAKTLGILMMCFLLMALEEYLVAFLGTLGSWPCFEASTRSLFFKQWAHTPTTISSGWKSQHTFPSPRSFMAAEEEFSGRRRWASCQ